MESIIDFKNININSISLEIKSKRYIINYNHADLYILTPILNLPYGLNSKFKKNFIDLNLNVDNNETQIFRSKIINLEKKIRDEYDLKKKFNASDNYNRTFNSNIKKISNEEFLRLKINNNTEKDFPDIFFNSNQKIIDFNLDNLNRSYCSFLLRIRGIWEFKDNYGIYIDIINIYIDEIKCFNKYSFISDDDDTNTNEQEKKKNLNNTFCIKNNLEDEFDIIDNKDSLEIINS